jgi:gamma-glutamylaminecyclotransferase
MLPRYMFVYGSLMRGYCNHHLLETSKFVSRARTIEKFAMFSSSFPYVNSNFQISHIEGEVYEVIDEKSWEELDELEEHPDVYERRPCQVELLATGKVITAELYFNEVYPIEGDGVELVSSGRYEV